MRVALGDKPWLIDFRYAPIATGIVRQRTMSQRANSHTFGQAVPETLRGPLDPHVDLAAQHPKIDWLSEKRLGPALQRIALGLRIAIGRDRP
jgi:hypothetical protein